MFLEVFITSSGVYAKDCIYLPWVVQNLTMSRLELSVEYCTLRPGHVSKGLSF